MLCTKPQSLTFTERSMPKWLNLASDSAPRGNPGPEFFALSPSAQRELTMRARNDIWAWAFPREINHCGKIYLENWFGVFLFFHLNIPSEEEKFTPGKRISLLNLMLVREECQQESAPAPFALTSVIGDSELWLWNFSQRKAVKAILISFSTELILLLSSVCKCLAT